MATKALQPVRYSVSLRKNPMDEQEPKKAYANLQLTGVLNINQLAQHIQDHNTVYSLGTIVGVITEMASCIRELLMQGFKIDLGALGAFAPSLSSTGASTIEKFSEENIKTYKAIYTMSAEFKNMRPEVQFKRVAARWQEDRLLEAVANGHTSVDLAPKPDDDNGNGGNGGTGN